MNSLTVAYFGRGVAPPGGPKAVYFEIPPQTGEQIVVALYRAIVAKRRAAGIPPPVSITALATLIGPAVKDIKGPDKPGDDHVFVVSWN